MTEDQEEKGKRLKRKEMSLSKNIEVKEVRGNDDSEIKTAERKGM